jgi:serine protease Do/serine protease DegQ
LVLALLAALLLVGTLPPAPQAGLPAFWNRGDELPSLAPMLQRVMPAVVNVSTRERIPVQENPLMQEPFFRRFFDVPDKPRERGPQSLGSGVIVDAQRGYILTNYHVVEKAQDIVVTLHDRRTVKARLVGRDTETDIAVLKIPADNLTALPMGDADTLRVGDFVAAIGNPFGLGQTVTSGIVSAVGRSGLGIEGYEDFIQTDASINPGNSGGPLVNLRGELVGLNAAILTPGGGNIGIGFATPVNMAQAVMEQLVAYGEVRRGRLGVVAQDLTPELVRSLQGDTTQGAVVTRLESGSPAARAGVRVGDVIIAINHRPVRSAADLRNKVGMLSVGKRVRLDLLRNGNSVSIEVALTSPRQTGVDGARIDPRLAGASLAVVDTPAGPALQVADLKAGSLVQHAGLREGDLIVAVNRMPVNDVASLQQAIQRGQRSMLISVQRGHSSLAVLIQ